MSNDDLRTEGGVFDDALDLLRTTGTPIADIAAECGFSSQSHLTTIFRQIADITPGRYRKRASG